MQSNLEDVDDDLLPSSSGPDWFRWALLVTLGQAFIGAAIWYRVYLTPMTRAELVELGTALANGSQPLFGSILVIAGLTVATFGPIAALTMHHFQLERDGADPAKHWLVLALLGIQFWPLTLLVVWKHYQIRRSLA